MGWDRRWEAPPSPPGHAAPDADWDQSFEQERRATRAAEAARHDAWFARQLRRERRRRLILISTATSVVGTLTVVFVLLSKSPTENDAPIDSMVAMTQAVLRPPAGIGEHATPIGRPAPVRTASTDYNFLETQEGSSSPVAWDPCRPIHYVVNDGDPVAGGDQLLHQAIERISRATGLRFIDDGSTDETPVRDRSAYQPERYGDHWAPVLIAWTDPGAMPDLAGDIIGRGGPTPFTNDEQDGPTIDVSGVVFLDAPDIRTFLRRNRDGKQMIRAMMMHELGHLVGLGHVHDPTQIMNPYMVHGTTDLGPGDLAGLARLGQGPCDPAA